MRPVPKAVALGTAPFSLRDRIGAAPGELLVLLPAGVRPVKQPRFPIAPLERLRARGLPIRLVVLGPILDPVEGGLLEAAIAARASWCARLEAPPEAVPAALAGADLVLNCSTIEGFSNALAEALACGRAVLAADIPGNRAAVVPDLTGVLFRPGDEQDFEAKARALLEDPVRRRRLGEAARTDARRRFDPAREIDALERVYREALGRVRVLGGVRAPRGRALPVVGDRCG